MQVRCCVCSNICPVDNELFVPTLALAHMHVCTAPAARARTGKRSGLVLLESAPTTTTATGGVSLASGDSSSKSGEVAISSGAKLSGEARSIIASVTGIPSGDALLDTLNDMTPDKLAVVRTEFGRMGI